MNIPKYWAHLRQPIDTSSGRYQYNCWQWSNTSEAEAIQRAQARVLEVAKKAASGADLDRYGYGDRPMREEIVIEMRNGSDTVAAITRNAYGALVLNAANAMFIDIDIDEDEQRRREPKVLEGIQRFAADNAGWGIRMYRTRGGLRGLFTHALFDPTDRGTADLLRALGSDPLYIRLCAAQQCFRARLTPKPWRCDAGKPPARFPFPDKPTEARYRAWVQRYEQASQSYGVCRLVGAYGVATRDPIVNAVLEVHDRYTRPGETLTLA
ncbi:MAG: hypothetical protein HZB53_18075 [Chloroflexi bacterium]|nr:hypothetical protein [Chloroflexota bacterium]